jgi:lincosamide nucleotidyltransferase
VGVVVTENAMVDAAQRRYVHAVLIQQTLIARVGEVCRADERLDAALMYGSFAHGEADAYSDIEFWLFFDRQRGAAVDPRTWCEELAPLTHHVRNEFGADVVFFPNLVRGEFHFATTDDIPIVRGWPARGATVDRMVILDRTGTLRPTLDTLPERVATPATGEEIEMLCGRFANWLVLAHQVACRGERLRAWDALAQVNRHLLWMARLVAGNTDHWLTPSRRAEKELPPHMLAELLGSTGAVGPADVRAAIRSAWQCGRRYWTTLAQRYGRPVPDRLFTEIDAAV